MRTTPALLAILAMSCTSAPKDHPNEMTTNNTHGEADTDSVRIHPVHHSAIVFEWKTTTIYVDPHDGAARFNRFAAPDLILLTDIHPDHLDTTTLRGLDLSKALIIAPQAVFDLLPVDLQKLCTVMANGAVKEMMGIGIEAVPMYNMPDPNDPRHPKGRGNGYVLSMGGERIYISGDTEDIPEMRALKNIDVAFVCMNLPYTMTVDQAASGVLAFKPRLVYPYHYRGTDGLSDVARFKQLVNTGDPSIEVRLMDWYKE
jgi:L-ascorbate metabolism protein UlaG (beta-lactamase superfamily)